MKALVYTQNEEVTYRDEQDATPESDEVVVEIDAVGICGSDMHAYLGHDARRVPPLILGHEASGKVMSGVHAGRRAVLNPLITCSVCDHCLDGRSNLCAERQLIGMKRPGAFAQQIAIPERNLIDIPDDMDAVQAALTEPAATALHAISLAARVAHRPLGEGRALVIGGGSVGLFAALWLKDCGCKQIDMAETNALRRATADKTGACAAFDPLATAPAEDSYDLVIDAVGGAATRAAAVSAAAAGGVIMHIGLMDAAGAMDVRKLTLSEITFIGTYTYTPVELRATARKLYDGSLGDLSWVEQRSLAEGASAFDDLLHGRSAAPKIVLIP